MKPKTTHGKNLPQRENEPLNDKPSHSWKGEKPLAAIGLLLVFFVGLYILPGIQDRKTASSKETKEIPDTDLPQTAPEPNRDVKQFSGGDSDSGETHRSKIQLSAETETQVTRRDLEQPIKDSEPVAGDASVFPFEDEEAAAKSPVEEQPDDLAAALGQTSESDGTQRPVEPSAPMSGRPAQSADAAKFTFYFRFNSTEVLDLLGKRRAGALEFVSQCKGKGKVEIVGHGCNIGPSDINLAIGLGRAGAVKDLLVRAGTDADRFNVRSEGEERPVASNQSPTGRAQNRRVEILCSKRDIGKKENNDLN